ncbi:MAG: phosphatase PAP2 family protein [Nitrospirae bacterium]|nr:MAG: phosphatase PAP2 family protein [Nitrospirota bacterium]
MKAWQRIIFSLSALVIFAVIGLKLHELDMPAARFVRSFDIEAVNYSGDLVAVLGRGVVIAGAFALIGLAGWRLKRERLRELGIRGLVAIAGIAAATQSLKHLVGRPRPRFAHADEFVLSPSLDSGLDSFPSGHAANAFGAAAVIAWFVPALRAPAYVVAGLVGLSRVVRGSHFPTDVFAAAVLGVLIGSLAAAGWKRWREDALPGLLRVGVPLAVALFLVIWVALHPAAPWPQEISYLGAGAALVLAGGLLRGVAGTGGPLRTAGNVAALLGVAVAVGPWWAGPLLLAALIPTSLAWLRPAEPCASFWKTGPVWGREALAVGSALVAIAALRALKGLLPLT